MTVRSHVREQLLVAGWVVMAYLALVTAVLSFRYVSGPPEAFDLMFRDKYLAHHVVVLVHGFSGVVTLALGVFQFWPRLLALFPGVHRAVGFIYLACVGTGGVSGFYMATMAAGGSSSVAALILMASLWLVTGGMALAAAWQGGFSDHRVWMVRNYALTFGAVTLRVYLYISALLGADFAAVYPIAAWMAWVPNLVVAEALFVRPSHPIHREAPGGDTLA